MRHSFVCLALLALFLAFGGMAGWCEEELQQREAEFVYTHGSLDEETETIVVPLEARHRALERLRMRVQEGALETVSAEEIGATWTQVGQYPIKGETDDIVDGLYTGRVSALAVDPGDSGVVYLGGANGGIWRGFLDPVLQRWKWQVEKDTLDDSLRGSIAIGSIAVDPHSDFIYAGTGESVIHCLGYYGEGIWKYDGNTWRIVGDDVLATMAVSDIIIRPGLYTSNVVWASTVYGLHGHLDASCKHVSFIPQPDEAYGLWLSNDYGETWGTAPLWDPEGDTDPQTSSYDEGITDLLYDEWSATVGGNTNCVLAAVVDTDQNDDARGVYRICSHPNDATQFLSSTRLLSFPSVGFSIRRIELAQDPNNSSIMYAAVSRENSFHGLYRTADGGAHWVLLDHPPTNPPEDLACQHENLNPDSGGGVQNVCERANGKKQCDYDLAIEVDQQGKVWLGGIGIWRGTYSTEKEAIGWQPMCSGKVHVDQQVMAFDSAHETLWLGNDGGVVSIDYNQTPADWVNRTTEELVLTQYYPGGSAARLGPDSDCVLGGTQDVGNVLHEGVSSQVGSAGQPSGWWTDGSGSAIIPGQIGTWLVSFANNFFWRTTDAGTTWTMSGQDHGVHLNRVATCPTPGVNRVLNLKRGGVNRSSDSGVSWVYTSSVHTPLGLAFGHDSVSACDSYWMSGFGPAVSNLKLYRVIGDDYFSDQTSCLEAPYCDVIDNAPYQITDMATVPGIGNEHILYVVTGAANDTAGSHLYISTDATTTTQATFTRVSGAPDFPILSILVDSEDPNRMFLGTDIGVFYTDGDHGEGTFAYMTDHPASPVYDLIEVDGFIYSFTHGRGAFRLDKSLLPSDSYRVKGVTVDSADTEVRAADLSMDGVLTVAGMDNAQNLWVSRLADGAPVWSRGFHVDYGADVANALITHGSGANEVIAAFGTCDFSDTWGGCIIQLDADGTFLGGWMYFRPGIAYWIEDAIRVSYGLPAQTGYVVVGYRWSDGGDAAWIALVNASSGTIEWQNALDGWGVDRFYGVTASSLGVTAVGATDSHSGGASTGVLIAKFHKASGELQDSAVLVEGGHGWSATGRDVVGTPGGGVIVVGDQVYGAHTSGLFLSLDQGFSVSAAKVFGSGYAGLLRDVTLHEGDYLVTGRIKDADGIQIPESGFWGVVTGVGGLLDSHVYHRGVYQDPWDGTASFREASDGSINFIGSARDQSILNAMIVKTNPDGTVGSECDLEVSASVSLESSSFVEYPYTFTVGAGDGALQMAPPDLVSFTTTAGSTVVCGNRE